MDEDQNGEIDYNDVVSFIEKWKICKSVEEQALNNQLFWSVIDQHKVYKNILLLRYHFHV